MSSLYKHLGFSDPAKQIRLLRLEPSPTGTDEYAFSLEVHDFQENSRPSYIAISYAWGLPIPKLPVVINGLRMRVQFNCWYALWQMRHHGYTSDVNFWIDSLCINQGNDEEKGHQVAMMGEIFSSASSVAASLGTGESLGNVREILISGNDREIGKLRHKFDLLPYFDRVWIKQEIILAREINIFYGLESLSWSEFDHAVNAGKTKFIDSPFIDPSPFIDSSVEGSDSSADSRESGPFKYDLDEREERRIFKRKELERISISAQLCNHRSELTKISTFIDLVARYRTAKASVAVDKIYALLSLLPRNDPIRQNLPVIYGQSTWFPLFRDLTKLLYSHYKNECVADKHDVLCLVRNVLEIRGLDEDVIAFFESQAWGPSNAQLFHQESATIEISGMAEIHKEDSEDLDHRELRVTASQADPTEIIEKLGLFKHTGHKDQRNGTGTHPKLHIPPQLKSLRTLYNFKKPQDWHKSAKSTRTPNPIPNETFLVNSDLRWRHACETELSLHYRDALIPLLLNHHPFQSLLYFNTVPNSGAIDLLSRIQPQEWFSDSEDSRDMYEYSVDSPNT
ncbi:hypothetical protein GCG54_00005123 [Colletotrichum gloeosporioides]|uniref:Heterokaryon incompatibility domain-containing protein n=1 Tax=Colletotrichum gloeosporioides TaxID=474922 RepID=A0A8H4FLX5_COLGL|nr:uncharacterized protein GCG54_00005123 [Colletotrichum gloeosporioides]KAF3805759.1 hypothetical protein GCG54_00005123 [Colletotrichum gloeosporioides]